MNITNIIANDVYALVNGFVEYVLRTSDFYIESPYIGDYTEIFQYYLISEWLGKKLEEQGEIIFYIEGHLVWGRTTYGQSLEFDACFRNMKEGYTPLPLCNDCLETLCWLGGRYDYSEILGSKYVGFDLNSIDHDEGVKLYFALMHEGTPCLQRGSSLHRLLIDWLDQNEEIEESTEYQELLLEEDEEC